MQLALSGWKNTKSAEIAGNLGSLLMAQGRDDEAESYIQAALQAWESTAGDNHLGTMHAIGALAQLHIAQGREDEAIPLLRRVASVYEAKLGRQHPATAGAYVDVGLALQIAKKYDEAEAIFREQLATLTATLGTGHLRTGSCLYGLATIKLKRGEMQAALDLLDQISAIHQQYPPNERSVATVHRFRAEALWKLGKRQEAIQEQQLAIAGLEPAAAMCRGPNWNGPTIWPLLHQNLKR